MDRLAKLQISQMDATFDELKKLTKVTTPTQGWARTIRQALGMSVRQLARRTGLSKTSVHSIETSEARGKVQLDSLEKLADGLNCKLVYALVPRTSLKQTLTDQARIKAKTMVLQVSDSMDLELQGIPDKEKKRQIEELAEEILRSKGRKFWDV